MTPTDKWQRNYTKYQWTDRWIWYNPCWKRLLNSILLNHIESSSSALIKLNWFIEWHVLHSHTQHVQEQERTKLNKKHSIYIIFILFSYQKQQRIVKSLLFLDKKKTVVNTSQTCGLLTTQIFANLHRKKQKWSAFKCPFADQLMIFLTEICFVLHYYLCLKKIKQQKSTKY